MYSTYCCSNMYVISWRFVLVCHRGIVHPAALWWVTGMVREAAQRVPQLPHAERVAKERVSASHYRPELRQGEGELEHTYFPQTPPSYTFVLFCWLLQPFGKETSWQNVKQLHPDLILHGKMCQISFKDTNIQKHCTYSRTSGFLTLLNASECATPL